MSRALVLALGMLTTLAATAARAAEPVIVSPAVTQGELGDAARAKLEQRLLEVVRKSDLAIIAVPDDAGRAAAGCADDRCRARLIADNNARFLLVPEITLDDQDYRIRLTLYAANGAQAAQLEETCGLCGLVEAESLIGDLGARIGRKIEVATRASSLEVRSDPAGARVFVANELVGTTPVELPLDAGVHDLRVELDGYIGLSRTVDVVAGETNTLELALQPVPVEPEQRDDGGNDRGNLFTGLGWGALAVGLVAAGGGGALIAIDEKPITSDCTGTNIDASGNCRWRYSTLEGGVGLVAGGVALVGTGIALIVIGRKRHKQASSAHLRMLPSPGGVAVQF